MLHEVNLAHQELTKIEEIKKDLRESNKEKSVLSQLYQQVKKSQADLKVEL